MLMAKAKLDECHNPNFGKQYNDLRGIYYSLVTNNYSQQSTENLKPLLRAFLWFEETDPSFLMKQELRNHLLTQQIRRLLF
jgi:hypothetical protein